MDENDFVTKERLEEVLRAIADAVRYDNPEQIDAEICRLYNERIND